jgi:class III poly(R)-hydroxyalkanoic acid synthase PhaE subunit
MSGAKGGHAAPAILTEWLSTPTLGYTRESQEEFQRLGQSVIAYQKAMQEYADVLSGVVRRASELLRDKALERARNGQSFESLRDCYNLWVDCGEEAYSEVSSSSEFTGAQARLVNALMAVKRQEQILMDEWLSALNMPTRRELDTSHRRVHELQRRVWRLEDASENPELSALRAEVAALREEVQSLREAGPGVAAATNTRRSPKAKADT